MADFGLYYHNFKYGHGNAKKVSNIVSWLDFKQLTVATAELSFFCRLSCQGCVPVKWTAPEVLFGDIAGLSSKSDVYVILFLWNYLIVSFSFVMKEWFFSGGGGYCLIWVIRVRAAGQGMVFGLTVLNRVYNRPFATSDHVVQNLPRWRASSLLFPHIKTKRTEPVKLDLPLFWCPSAGIIMSLPSSMAHFVPRDR